MIAASAARGIAYLETFPFHRSFLCAGLRRTCGMLRNAERMYYRIPPARGLCESAGDVAQGLCKLDDTIAEAHTLLAGAYAWKRLELGAELNWNTGGALQLAPPERDCASILRVVSGGSWPACPRPRIKCARPCGWTRSTAWFNGEKRS